MSYADLKKTFSGIDWDTYLKGLGIKEVAELNVMQIEPLKEVEKLINTLPVSKHISYLQYNLLDAAAPYLSDDFIATRFDFYGKVLSGRQQNSPRWKRAVSAVESMLGEAVGQMYVEKYFPAAAKERMVKLVKNLQDALGERIKAQEWMSDSTKMVALENCLLSMLRWDILISGKIIQIWTSRRTLIGLMLAVQTNGDWMTCTAVWENLLIRMNG